MDSWDFQQPRGAFRLGSLAGELNIEFPQRGLHSIELAGKSLPAVELMGIEPPGLAAEEGESLLEAYARGRDLVATYAQSPARSVRPQCYWRGFECATAAGECAGIEVIFSMQTSLLQSAPQASVVTKLPVCETQRLVDAESGQFEPFTVGPATPENGSGLFVFTSPEQDWRLVTMIEPSDFVTADLASAENAAAKGDTVSSPPMQAVRYQLFPHSLEKGVIRRARLLGLFLPTEGNGQELALECYQQFLSAPVPLST